LGRLIFRRGRIGGGSLKANSIKDGDDLSRERAPKKSEAERKATGRELQEEAA